MFFFSGTPLQVVLVDSDVVGKLSVPLLRAWSFASRQVFSIISSAGALCTLWYGQERKSAREEHMPLQAKLTRSDVTFGVHRSWIILI
jgi:hypothetical protein